MTIVARLRVRAPELMATFGPLALGSIAQVAEAEGCLGSAFLQDDHLTFWNATVWRDEPAMRAFRNTGAHGNALAQLAALCDEATMLHWEQDSSDLPAWQDAHARLELEGRPSKLDHPAPTHFNRRFPAPVPLPNA